MKVCGVTYCHSRNYGTCLQTYALQKAVQALGYEYSVLDLSYYFQAYGIRKLRFPKTVKSFAVRKFARLYFERQFQKFEKENIVFTKPVYKYDDIKKIDRDTDAFICGSDVVWNTDFNYNHPVYYLGFTDKYKFSYAASFGKGKLNEKDKKMASRYLPGLDAISVREKTSVNEAEILSGKNAQAVVDPVLLLDASEWQKIIAPVTEKQHYIFVYITHHLPALSEFTEKLSEKTGLKVISSEWTKSGKGNKNGYMIGPDLWLGLIKNADYVITNSFHCTAFSVLFKKEFFSYVSSSGKAGIGSRLYDFLDNFGFSDRVFTECPSEADFIPLDYSGVDGILADMKEESIGFLKSNLELAEKRADNH